MDIELEPGTYVVAVSGGVDSMVLLDLLAKQTHGSRFTVHATTKRYRFVVAHFDHGIRPDSAEDRKLVKEMAAKYGLPFVHHEGNLGPGTSESKAREARYEFLHKVREAVAADAILTAHHQDDAIETAVHNLLRGTGRKGLSSLKHTRYVKRPLLEVSKSELKSYAEDQGLKWREDSTNQDLTYRRNYIRHKILPKLTLQQKADLLTHIQRARELNKTIDHEIANVLKKHGIKTEFERKSFIKLPHNVAREVMAAWLRQNGIRSFDRKLLERLVIAAKTYGIGKAMHIDRQHYLLVDKQNLALRTFER